MKVKKVISQLSKLKQDGDIYLAQHIVDDNGEHVDTKYMEIELAPWNEPDEGLYILYPGDLISG
jgi:hypothetical protein